MKYFVWIFLFIFSNPSYSQITEDVFRKTLSEFETLYTPRIKTDLNSELSLTGIWTPKSIIAMSSTRVTSDEVCIQIDGAFAQKEHASKEALVLIICHEFGHVYNDRTGMKTLVKEGRADTYAPRCALDFFNQSEREENDRSAIPTDILEKCSLDATCMRVASGIASFAKVYNVDLEALDASENGDYVAHHSLHPSSRCRVKTFLAGLFQDEIPQCTITPSLQR